MNEQFKKAFDNAETYETEGPLPLIRKVDPAAVFPVNALGKLLGSAASAIHDITQAPLSMCSQSVLAAATLAAQGLADVKLPRGGGKGRPLSGFYITVAATGERKSTVDNLALEPVRKREGALRQQYDEDLKSYIIKAKAYEAAEKKAKQIENGKDAYTAIEANLRKLGDAPLPPLKPMLTCTDPTVEGLGKMLATAWPSLGIFSAEGATFVGGYGMSEDNRIKTAGALSGLWDGTPVDRVRSLDGVSIMVGRRVSAHLMMQPGVADKFLGAGDLADQGLLSRLLLAAPDSTAGTRFESGRSIKPESQAILADYEAALALLLESPLPLAEGKRNELTPPALTFSLEAEKTWVEFYDHVEAQIREGGNLEPVKGLACKMAEHAGRIAGVLTLVESPAATTIQDTTIESAIEICGYYLEEGLRLFGCAGANADLAKADKLRRWLLSSKWPDRHISYTDLTHDGPNWVRDGAQAFGLLRVLEQYRWLIPAEAPVMIKGKKRREAWEIAGKVVQP